MAISTNGTIITRLAGALYNEYLSNASYTELNTTAAATVAANMLTSDFAGKTDAQLAKTILANLGLSSVAGLDNWVSAQLTAAGSTAAAKGAKLVSMLNDFAMMTADATYGSYATAFNANTAASLTSSQKAGTASGSFATSGATAAAAAAAAIAAAAAAEAAAKVIADAAAAKVLADAAAAAAKVIADADAAKVIADAAAAKVIADAAAAAVAPQKFALTIGVDNGSDFTGKGGSDIYTATTTSNSLQTLTAGDVLAGGDGDDTLNITNTVSGATLGAGVVATSIETVNVTATGTTTLNTSGFTGVKSVSNTGSTSDVIFSNLPAIADVSVTAASGATTVGFATAVTSGSADSVKLALNGATGSVTIQGFETVNVETSGTASGTAAAPVVISDTSLKNLTVTGTTANFLSASFEGAGGTTVATVTGSAGADSLVLTAGGSAKVSGDMGAGNDNLRLTTIAAGYTVAGGEGTDTITYGGSASASATATANLSSFETVTLTAAPASFSLAGATAVNYTTVAPTASTYVGLASGGTLALPLGGTTTLTNTLWTTPTTDTLNVTVGAATTAGALTAAVTTTGMESVTITNSSVGTDTTSLRTVGVTDALLKSLTVTGNQPTALTGGGAALTTLNVSGVTGNVTMAGLSLSTTVASTITGGDGNDTLTAATANLADSIVGGAGNDTITGGQGADTLTGGTGNDTFTVAVNSGTAGVAQVSGATLMDTITDFVTGTDKLNLVQATSFLGNYANLTAGLAATTGSGVGANQAFYSLADNIVYVIATAGTLSATDTMVKLSNAPATLAAADMNFGATGGATITLAVAASVVTPTVTVNTTTSLAQTTNATDAISSTIAFLAGTTIDTGLGEDTLTLTTAGAVGALAATLTNIETLNLATVDTTANTGLAFDDAGVFKNVNGSSNADTITSTANLRAGGSISLGAGNDVITALALFEDVLDADTSLAFNIDMSSGDDTVTTTTAVTFTAASTLAGGSGADTLNLVNLANISLGTVTGFETIVLAGAATMTRAQYASATTAVNGNGGITFADAGAVTQLAASTGLTFQLAATGNALTLNATGTNVITGGAVVDSVTVNAGWSVADTFDGAVGVDTLTIAHNVGGAIDLGGTAATLVAVENVIISAAQAAAYTLTLDAQMLTLDASASGTFAITVPATIAAMTSIKLGAGNDIITSIVANTAAQVIDLGAGNDTVTITATGAGALQIITGTGNTTIVDIAANAGAGAITITASAPSANATSAISVAATAANFKVGDIFDFAGNVTAVVIGAANGTLGVANAVGQLFVDSVTNGANTILTFDADGSRTFSAGDVQITIVGNVITGGIDGNGNFIIGGSA